MPLVPGDNKGLTLIEILAALTVVSLISGSSFMLLRGVTGVQKRALMIVDSAGNSTTLATRLARELESALPLAKVNSGRFQLINQEKDGVPNDILSFTTAGPHEVPIRREYRISFPIDSKSSHTIPTLICSFKDPSGSSIKRDILKGVISFDIEILDGGFRNPEWFNQGVNTLPKVAEISLEYLDDAGRQKGIQFLVNFPSGHKLYPWLGEKDE